MKKTLTVLAALGFSASSMAVTPESYDTKFNVSANVPDSAVITDPSGRPVTNLNVEMVPAPSGNMEALVPALKLWNNDLTKLEIALTLDDGNSAKGDAFTLMSTNGDVLNSMTYKIRSITSNGSKTFESSGDTYDYTLAANGKHGELPISFRFISNEPYSNIGQGAYTGTVYANVVAKP